MTFKLDGETLTIESNQVGFTEGDVRAICDICASNKTVSAGEKKDTIGEKGLGTNHVSGYLILRLPICFQSSQACRSPFKVLPFRIRC